MPRKFLHGLKKARVRQSWSKYNLYNLTRVTTPPAANKNFFQQKWLAKSLTRGYHNPDVREGQWTRMFDRRLPAVVPMDYRYLARSDGSEMAYGRGGGLEQEPVYDASRKQESGDTRSRKTPYMHMTFFPLERRLDTAVFRALFASSVRQARQFCTRGHVTVNGKKMIYPGYLLNPGDLFRVSPELVMWATGARKATKGGMSEGDVAALKERQQAQVRRLEEEKVEEEESEAGAATVESDEERQAILAQPESQDDPKKALKSLMTRARRILDDSKRKLSGKRQQELREFARSVRLTMSKFRGIEEEEVEDTVDGLEASLAAILSKVPQDTLAKDESQQLGSLEAAQAQDDATEAANKTADAATAAATVGTEGHGSSAGATSAASARSDAEVLHAALARARENPIDASKPYATPWRPRDYMSAFAFIPRYLEVNQNICAAVYLRHPVARPGLAEAPTPFAAETMGLAFNWYLRRR